MGRCLVLGAEKHITLERIGTMIPEKIEPKLVNEHNFGLHFINQTDQVLFGETSQPELQTYTVNQNGTPSMRAICEPLCLLIYRSQESSELGTGCPT